MRLQDAAAALSNFFQRTGVERPQVHTRWTDAAVRDAAGDASRPNTEDAEIRTFEVKSNAQNLSRVALSGTAGDASEPSVQEVPHNISERHLEQLMLSSEARSSSCMHEVAEMLRKIPALSLRPIGHLEVLCRLSTVEFLKAGDYVFRAREHADESYFVLTGRVTLESRPDSAVDDANVDFKQGTSLDLGLPLIRDKICRRADAICKTDSMVLRLRRDDLELARGACDAEAFLDLLHKAPSQRDDNDLSEIDENCLGHIAAFSGLHVNVRRRIARHLRPELVQKPALLWNKDDETENMYITYGAILEICGTQGTSRGVTSTTTLLARSPSGRPLKKRNSQASSPVPDREKEVISPPKSPLMQIARTGSLGGKAVALTRIASLSSNTNANGISRTTQVLQFGGMEVDGLVQGGGVAGQESQCGARRNRKCVVRETGFVLVLSLEQLQTAVVAHMEAESLRKSDLVKTGLDLEIVLRSYSTSVDKRAELLAKMLACFSSRHFARGEILGVQREPVEDIFIMDTASCTMRLVAQFEMFRRDIDSEDRDEFSQALVLRPAMITRKTMDITNAGPMDCVGITDFFMSGRWGASVNVTQSGSVLVANRKRLFSVFEHAHDFMKCLRELQRKKIKARLRRLRQCINALQEQGLSLTATGAASSDNLYSIFATTLELVTRSPVQDTVKVWRPPAGGKKPGDITVRRPPQGSSLQLRVACTS